jgi:hypothetical protein
VEDCQPTYFKNLKKNKKTLVVMEDDFFVVKFCHLAKIKKGPW